MFYPEAVRPIHLKLTHHHDPCVLNSTINNLLAWNHTDAEIESKQRTATIICIPAGIDRKCRAKAYFQVKTLYHCT